MVTVDSWLVVTLAILAVFIVIALVIIARHIINHAAELVTKAVVEPQSAKIEVAIFNRMQLGDTVRYLRQAGFFANAPHLSDLDLAREIAYEAEQEMESSQRATVGMAFRMASGSGQTALPRPANWYAAARTPFADSTTVDMVVASFDAGRVWWQDRDRVYRNAGGYVRTLREWSAISRGAFNPEDISESWGSDGDMVIVTFTLNGEHHRFVHLTSLDSFVDTVGLRDLINPLLAPTGYQFAVCAVRDDPNFVVVLTDGEKLRLQAERGWEFAEWTSLVV